MTCRHVTVWCNTDPEGIQLYHCHGGCVRLFHHMVDVTCWLPSGKLYNRTMEHHHAMKIGQSTISMAQFQYSYVR